MVGAGVFLVIAIAVVAVQLRSSSLAQPPSLAYYSDDDGKTFFPDDATKIVPFDHDGKQAYRAYVFAAGGKQFVGYLARYTPAARAALEKARSPEASQVPPVEKMKAAGMISEGLEVSKPGSGKWLSQSKAQELMKVKAPDGSFAMSVNP